MARIGVGDPLQHRNDLAQVSRLRRNSFRGERVERRERGRIGGNLFRRRKRCGKRLAATHGCIQHVGDHETPQR